MHISAQMTERKRTLTAAVLMLTLLGTTTAAEGQQIDTRNGATVPMGGLALGASGSLFFFREIGQSFVSPTGYQRLDSFSIFITSSGGSPAALSDFYFKAVLRATDGATPIGPTLYSSDVRSQLAADLSDRNVLKELSFVTGGVLLAPGQLYVASLVALESNPTGGRYIPSLSFDSYSSGGIVSSPNNSLTANRDLAFIANFTAVPEPSTWMLATFGLLGVGAAARRRRHGSALTPSSKSN